MHARKEANTVNCCFGRLRAQHSAAFNKEAILASGENWRFDGSQLLSMAAAFRAEHPGGEPSFDDSSEHRRYSRNLAAVQGLMIEYMNLFLFRVTGDTGRYQC
jgi:hypothetical protein